MEGGILMVDARDEMGDVGTGNRYKISLEKMVIPVAWLFRLLWGRVKTYLANRRARNAKGCERKEEEG